jgi:hypothetical protein
VYNECTKLFSSAQAQYPTYFARLQFLFTYKVLTMSQARKSCKSESSLDWWMRFHSVLFLLLTYTLTFWHHCFYFWICLCFVYFHNCSGYIVFLLACVVPATSCSWLTIGMLLYLPACPSTCNVRILFTRPELGTRANMVLAVVFIITL